ncbi:MAG: hypothetical protein ACYDH4_08650 [Candidatus Cryosericum sp.]
MSTSVVSLSSLLKRTTRTSDGQIITRPISGRMSAVLDSCGTARKLSDNFGRIKLYVYDMNTGDVLRDEKHVPISFNRQYASMSTTPWRQTSTGGEAAAQVRHAVVHCDVIRDLHGNSVLNEDGGKTFKWTVVQGEFAYIADAERPELVGTHQFGDTVESIVIDAQTKGTDLVPAAFEDGEADLLADFELARA